MTARDVQSRPRLTSGVSGSGGVEYGAALVGALLGGVVGGGALYLLAPGHLALLGAIVDVPSAAGGFLVWLVIAVLLGIGFAVVAGPAVNAYTNVVIKVTSRSDAARRVVQPLVMRSAMGTTASGIGLAYGIGAGIVVGAVAVPAVAGATTPFDPGVPSRNAGIVIAYALFGYVTGLGYGLALEGSIPVPSLAFVGPRLRALVVAPLLAGAISGAVLYAGRPVYLLYLGDVVGTTTYEAGFAVWMVLSVLLGFLFAATGGRPAEYGGNTAAYGLVYGLVGAVFLGVLALPYVIATTSQHEFTVPHANPVELVAFVVYGVVLGSAYGSVRNHRPIRPDFLVGRTRATVFSAVVAGGAVGGLLFAYAGFYLLLLAEVAGSPGDRGVGLVVWLALSLLFGLVFATLPAMRIDRVEDAYRAGLRLGLAYGVLLAGVGMFGVQAVLASTLPYGIAVPNTNGVVVGAYSLVGLLIGVVYGITRQSGGLLAVVAGPRGTPTLAGAAAGGAVGAIVVYAASSVYFTVLGGIVGTPALGAGLGVWFALVLLLGALFGPLCGRLVEVDPDPLRGLVVGLGYGVALAALVGAFGVPAVVNATTEYALQSPHLAAPLAGYVLFGAVLGAVFAHLSSPSVETASAGSPLAIGSEAQRATLFGSLFGGFAGGLVIHHAFGPVGIRYVGSIVGQLSNAGAWLVWLGLSLILGGVFSFSIDHRLEAYGAGLEDLAERNPDVAALLGPAIDGAPVTSAATAAGLAYGVVVAFVVGSVAIPIVVNTTTQFRMPVPTFEVLFLVGFVVYGLLLGLGYGVVREF